VKVSSDEVLDVFLAITDKASKTDVSWSSAGEAHATYGRDADAEAVSNLMFIEQRKNAVSHLILAKYGLFATNATRCPEIAQRQVGGS
jgi:hypothetical protein